MGLVRWHRASISLSTEEESDSSKTKQIKRKADIRKLALGAMLSLALGVITTTYLIELQDLRNKILGFFLSFAPSLYVAGTCIVKVLPDLLQSRGSKYLKEVKKFDKTGRPDFSQRTGFMGEVKKEIEYLFDFLRLTHYSDDKMKKRRLIHLAVFIDDLDRCDKSTVMKVLQASILLLV